jgi:hypothetical protein
MKFECRSFVCRIVNVCLPVIGADNAPGRHSVVFRVRQLGNEVWYSSRNRSYI